MSSDFGLKIAILTKSLENESNHVRIKRNNQKVCDGVLLRAVVGNCIISYSIESKLIRSVLLVG